ncbi:hypothetical protein GCM10010360_64630 [Streptomyces nogalater]
MEAVRRVPLGGCGLLVPEHRDDEPTLDPGALACRPGSGGVGQDDRLGPDPPAVEKWRSRLTDADRRALSR